MTSAVNSSVGSQINQQSGQPASDNNSDMLAGIQETSAAGSFRAHSFNSEGMHKCMGQFVPGPYKKMSMSKKKSILNRDKGQTPQFRKKNADGDSQEIDLKSAAGNSKPFKSMKIKAATHFIKKF